MFNEALDLDWYLVVADRRGMNTAEASLRQLGHEVYYPRETIAATRMNRRVKIERSLLYKYIFVGVRPGSSFYDISEAKGVYQLLEDADGRPALIREQDVERFRRDERYGLFDKTSRGKEPIPRGAEVVVLEGAFQGWKGVVRRCHKFNKARVFLGGKIIVEISIDQLDLA